MKDAFDQTVFDETRRSHFDSDPVQSRFQVSQCSKTVLRTCCGVDVSFVLGLGLSLKKRNGKLDE